MKSRILTGAALAAGLMFAGTAFADDIKMGVAGPLTVSGTPQVWGA